MKLTRNWQLIFSRGKSMFHFWIHQCGRENGSVQETLLEVICRNFMTSSLFPSLLIQDRSSPLKTQTSGKIQQKPQSEFQWYPENYQLSSLHLAQNLSWRLFFGHASISETNLALVSKQVKLKSQMGIGLAWQSGEELGVELHLDMSARFVQWNWSGVKLQHIVRKLLWSIYSMDKEKYHRSCSIWWPDVSE